MALSTIDELQSNLNALTGRIVAIDVDSVFVMIARQNRERGP